MGCCITTPKKHDQNTLKNQQNSTQETTKCKVQQPQPKSPPLIVEEEFVKEILFETETPISKPQQVSILTQETMTQMQNIEITKEPIMNKASEEVSNSIVSETCSVSESYSYSTTTTATVPETKEDEVTSKRRIRERNPNRNRYRNNSDLSTRKRSYAVDGNRIGGRERRRLKSPARLPEVPPENNVVVGSRLDRRTEFSDKVRRDSGEGVSRRSRSPSCRRKVGSSDCRSELRQTEKTGRRVPPPGKSESEERNDGVSVEESFMNPHVSLECFIFL